MDGDYSRALYWLGSHQVAAGIVELVSEGWLDEDELCPVLFEHWDRCDGGGQYRAEMLALFRRVGYVSDTGRVFSGPVIVYRGNLGEDPRLGLSWTLSKAKARWFALYALGPRAQFLGLRRADDGEPAPTVWRGIVDAEDCSATSAGVARARLYSPLRASATLHPSCIQGDR